MNTKEDFLALVSESIANNEFNKLTLSKPRYKWEQLQNVYFKISLIKEVKNLTATLRNKTNDLTKNFKVDHALIEMSSYIGNQFLNATLVTTAHTTQFLSSKKGKVTIKKSTTKGIVQTSAAHDREKTKRSPLDSNYLYHLGITTSEAELIPKMADKYRQINKYLEIMDQLISTNQLTKDINIVDMGSGKGYLTFALYDFLVKQGKSPHITGIELREDLVSFCNEKAKVCGFDQLQFSAQRIEDYETKSLDILIALHACDTATDDAMAKGLHANAKLIVCAPCCHKQVRQQVKGKRQINPMLQHGIFQERHFEMVTDTIRALILEKNGYESKIFEFVSNEHTRKNIMLVASKSKNTNIEQTQLQIDQLKKEYQIDFQYLERLV